MNKKQFFSIPDEMKEREWYGFNWLEHVTAIPAPLVLVTGYKQNGAANATMQSWFCFSSENEFYCIFGSVNKGSHMYEIATGRKQMVINFPDKYCIDRCMDTVKNNGYETDELSASGLHYCDGSKVDAPVVDECFLNLECETVWEKELFEGSYHAVLCVKIVNVRMDEAHYNSEKLGRYGETGYLYNVNAPLNPETWETDDNEEFAILRAMESMKLKLVKASAEYRSQINDMMEEWNNYNEKIVPYAIRRSDYRDFENYCNSLDIRDDGSGLVPDSTFFCLDTKRNIMVGAVNIRHYLNESLLLNGGHIGDGVRPSERRKGIATKMIALALEECRKLGLKKVLMVCDKNNIGSAKSIINNGGILENEIEVDGVTEQRYWIDIAK